MHRYFTFVTAGLALLVSSISITVVAVALPGLTGDLGTNVLWAAWSISIYPLATTVIMPLAGRVSDTLGHRRVFLLSLDLFTLSSFFCGMSPNIYFLLLFRFLQGIGGGCFLPAAAGIVASNFPENPQAAIGLFSSIFAIGGLVGPNLGGWIVENYSWRYIFYLNVPVGVALIGLMLLSPKESETVVQRSFDLPGVALLSATILLLMLGFNFVSEKSSIFYYFLAAFFIAASGYSSVLFFAMKRKQRYDPGHRLVEIEALSRGERLQYHYRRRPIGGLLIRTLLCDFGLQALHLQQRNDLDSQINGCHSRFGDYQFSAHKVGLPMAHGLGLGDYLPGDNSSWARPRPSETIRPSYGSYGVPGPLDAAVRDWYGDYSSALKQRLY